MGYKGNRDAIDNNKAMKIENLKFKARIHVTRVAIAKNNMLNMNKTEDVDELSFVAPFFFIILFFGAVFWFSCHTKQTRILRSFLITNEEK